MEGAAGQSEINNLLTACFSVIASLCYCYFIAGKFPKGLVRLISFLPVFYLFTILPPYLSSAFFRAVTGFFITWLATFKLLLFAFDQGPLSLEQPRSLPAFITIASLPIKITQKNRNSTETHKKPTKVLPLNLATESLAFSVLVKLVSAYKDHLHPKILLVAYCCLVFLLIEVLIALSSYVVRAFTGLELEQPSDEPYISSSLQDFWGRRWNLTVTNTLRYTVYKPVRSISATLLGNDWAPLPAVLAAFLVSGLMHELLFYYVTRASPSWEMTTFFVLHGVCVVVEFGLKAALTDKWRLPWVVSGPLTVGFVMATSFWLFFPPLVRNGADTMVLEEFGNAADFVKSEMLKLSIFVSHNWS